FSRNFGKEAGMLAGLKAAKGDYVAVMDADLQDPPELLLEMYDTLSDKDTEFDCVGTRRVSRKGEPVIRSFFAKMFYKIINKISDTEIVDGARDFRLMTRQMVDAIISLPEYNRFSKGLFGWVGFNTKWLEYENIERKEGTTKWSFWTLFLYSIDGILAFSTAPLAIATIVGFVISVLAFILAIKFLIEKIFIGIAVAGYATLIIVVLFLGGLQLMTIGILGQYLAKCYTEIKQRPKYIVKQTSIKK
ncbi:MAG: glycosyltransferase family 2 protein, partial [Oscillospiraceae bacterium]